MIGDEVEVTILSVTQDQVRVGIKAPREIPIHRQEVYQAIVRQNQRASYSTPPSPDLLDRLKLADLTRKQK